MITPLTPGIIADLANQELACYFKIAGARVDATVEYLPHDDSVFIGLTMRKECVQQTLDSIVLTFSCDGFVVQYLRPLIKKLPTVQRHMLKHQKIKRMKARAKCKGRIRLAA